MTIDGSQNFDADLLVVGMGPAGDVLACLARLNGLSVIAIDKSAEIYPFPRAAVFDHEIMRVFQMLGMAASLEPQCRIPPHYRFMTADGQTLLHFEISHSHPVSGWADTYALHQPGVEQALRDRMAELGVDIRLSTGLENFTQDEDGVTATVAAPTGPTTLRTRYLVGSDGASSRAREILGTELFDYNFNEPWLVLDTILAEGQTLPIDCMQICDPKRPVTHMGMNGRRFRWEFMLKPGETAADMLDPAKISSLLSRWIDPIHLTIERKAVYQFHGLLAKHWRTGRVLLAGDAAHQMPPFAGQGMCAGIRDAANLAWKLAAVLQGKADATLLDSYQQEREAHVRQIIETAIAMGRVVCILDEAAAAERNAGMLARKASGAQDIAMEYPGLSAGFLLETPTAGAQFPQFLSEVGKLDDLAGPGAWLITTASGASAPLAQVINPADPAFAPFAPALTDWLAAQSVEAVLVRPDRYVFGIGGAAELADQWAARLNAA